MHQNVLILSILPGSSWYIYNQHGTPYQQVWPLGVLPQLSEKTGNIMDWRTIVRNELHQKFIYSIEGSFLTTKISSIHRVRTIWKMTKTSSLARVCNGCPAICGCQICLAHGTTWNGYSRLDHVLINITPLKWIYFTLYNWQHDWQMRFLTSNIFWLDCILADFVGASRTLEKRNEALFWTRLDAIFLLTLADNKRRVDGRAILSSLVTAYHQFADLMTSVRWQFEKVDGYI